MQTCHSINDLRALVKTARKQGQRIVFVPTMGNLHAGHISLVTEAKKHGDFIVVSIFVNPMQFGANEDLDAYPRTLAADQDKLRLAGAQVVFAPNAAEIYPSGLASQTVVSTAAISNKLCGASRPGHFDGVSTVVTKLFNIVQPDTAIFGLKDFQQLMIIRQMVSDLNMPIDVIGVPTARADSGLALSSRNGFLTDAQREAAAIIYKTMMSIKAKTLQGDANFSSLIDETKATLVHQGFDIDYVEICETATLEPAQNLEQELVLLVAAKMGSTRLIDNLVL